MEPMGIRANGHVHLARRITVPRASRPSPAAHPPPRVVLYKECCSSGEVVMAEAVVDGPEVLGAFVGTGAGGVSRARPHGVLACGFTQSPCAAAPGSLPGELPQAAPA